MAKLSFPTSREVSGPLLIDSDQLQALDKLIDRHVGPLREYKDLEIAASTEREIQRRLARGTLKEEQVEAQRERIRQSRLFISSRLERDSRSVALYLKGGREVQAERFSEAIDQPIGSGEEAPVGLALYLAIGSVRATVRLADVSWRKELSVEVEPNDVEAAQALFGALSNWATDVEAPKWQQRWLNVRWFFGLLLATLVFFGFLLIPFLSWKLAGERASRMEARKLLVQGINANNERRAIELILAIESRYGPEGQTSMLGIRYWSYVAIGMLGLISTVICPRVCIGVWKGKQRIRAVAHLDNNGDSHYSVPACEFGGLAVGAALARPQSSYELRSGRSQTVQVQ